MADGINPFAKFAQTENPFVTFAQQAPNTAAGMTREQIMERMRAESARRGGLEAASARAAEADQIAMDKMRAGNGLPPEGMVYNPNTGQMTSREMIANNVQPNMAEAATYGGAQGATFNLSDEATGAINAVIPGGGTMGERYDFGREYARGMLDAARRDHPVATLSGEIGGAISTGTALGKGAQSVANSGTLGTEASAVLRAASTPPQTLRSAIPQGAAVGAAYGSAYGAGGGEGGAENRVGNAVDTAKWGALFGGVAPAAINIGTKAFRAAFGRSAAKPTIESLAQTKNAAYRAVDDSGEKFTSSDLQSMLARARTSLDDVNFIPEGDPQTAASLKTLENVSSRDLTIGQLDKVRQSLWGRYNRSQEPGILSLIDEIDGLVQSRGSTSELMAAARLANSRFKKAEELQRAFSNAERQVSATGSGGNTVNKFRQAVTSILNNPKRVKWFSAEEVKAMENFVKGNLSENIMRRIGKIAPSGNGLMLALNIGAVANNPAMAGFTVAGSAAKGLADRAANRGAESLVGLVGRGGPAQRPPVTYPNPNALGAAFGALGQN